jgi:hypothetical protein
MEKMVKIPLEDFEKINIIKSSIDIDLLEQIISSLNDIKEGRVTRVK